eukprot:5496631-Pleurochrysis_carterae.AAC.1
MAHPHEVRVCAQAVPCSFLHNARQLAWLDPSARADQPGMRADAPHMDLRAHSDHYFEFGVELARWCAPHAPRGFRPKARQMDN